MRKIKQYSFRKKKVRRVRADKEPSSRHWRKPHVFSCPLIVGRKNQGVEHE